MITKDEIIKKLGIDSLDYDTQQKALENVATAVSTRMWRKISETLNEDDLDSLEKLIDEGKDEEVEKLIKAKFPNYEEFAIATENEVIDDIVKDKKSSEEALAKLSNAEPASN